MNDPFEWSEDETGQQEEQPEAQAAAWVGENDEAGETVEVTPTAEEFAEPAGDEDLTIAAAGQEEAVQPATGQAAAAAEPAAQESAPAADQPVATEEEPTADQPPQAPEPPAAEVVAAEPASELALGEDDEQEATLAWDEAAEQVDQQQQAGAVALESESETSPAETPAAGQAEQTVASEPVVAAAAAAAVGEPPAADAEPTEQQPENEEMNSLQTSAVSGKLTAEDRESILQAIEQIKQKLSYAAELSEEQRRRLFRIGEDGRQFILRALELAQQNSGILPRSFDVEEFQRDVELLEALRPIDEQVRRLAETVEALMEAAGSDAFSAALEVYQAAKFARCGEELDQFLAGPTRQPE